jgi:hypothetical protein
MANMRREPVGYQPFRARPLLQDGLLGVARPDGSAERQVASTLFSAATGFGQEADRVAERRGERAGQAAALAGAPQVAFDGVPSAEPDGNYVGGAVGVIIEEAAKRHGVDPQTMKAIAWIESKGRVNAKNPNSSAGGLFQFIDSTAAQYGLSNKFDPVAASDAGARLAKDNIAYLTRSLGRAPTPGEVYLAHQQGAGGAVKLLKNANRPAVQVVGADAVSLNGGSSSMTAGQFASLWTSKLDGRNTGGAALALDTMAAPAPNAGGGLTVSGGGYRPTGRDTIYGRAYDKAGTAIYWSQLETEMRSTAQQAYMLHGDDPAKLEEVFTELAREQMREHVFPEIAADYAVGFQRLTEGYMLDARKKQIARQKEADRAGFIERTNELLTTQEQQLAAMEPGSAHAAEAIAGSQAAIDAHYDDAVRRGIMSADDAAGAKITASRNAALRFYERQAEGKTPAEIRDLKTAMQADFADGGIEGLDGAGWQTLSSRLDQMERGAASEERTAGAALAQRGDDMATRILQGFDVDQATIGKFLLDANTAPGGQAIAQEAMAKIEVARAMRDMSLPEARAELERRRKALGDNPTDAEIRTFQFGERVLADRKQKLATDPLTYAEQQRDIEPTPMLTEADSPEAMTAIMQTRIGQADTVSDLHGVAPRYLKAGEAKAIAAAVKANPEQGAAIAGAIVSGSGERAAAVLAEFGTDAPVIAEAGTILAAGGSGAAASDVVRGYSKDAKTKMKPAAEKQLYDREVEGALSVQPRDAQRIGRAASAITRARLTDDAIEPDSPEADAVYVQALNEAAGAVYQDGVQYGGFADYSTGVFSSARVLAPNIIPRRPV